MNVCIPIAEDHGLASRIFPHFGSAPLYLVVDSATRACRVVANTDQHHEHGRCHPLGALRAESVEAVVAAGIGAGALSRLLQAGVAVYGAGPHTASELLDALTAGTLAKLDPADACAQVHGHGHGQGDGHCHGHGHGGGHGHGHCHGPSRR
jgi:predicted Fe-Mo cluster-binding NifX family protein